MVVVEKNGNSEAAERERSNGGRPGSASTSNGHRSDESPGSSSDEEHEPGMRIGAEYQAVIPDVVETGGPMKTDFRPEALLVWAPCMDVSEVKLDEYIHVAKEKYGYNTEQALGMLFWHKYNVAKSLADLPNFTPFPSEWTVEDKVLFEQAFSFHGKSFHRIRQMLPDKSISTLVRYYYQWKKTRTRTSLMDRHVRKLTSAQKDNDENESGENSNDSDFDPDKETQKGDGSKSGCSNCAATMSQLHTTPKGQFCNQCYSYWRRTGVMRVHTGPVRNESHSLRHHPVRTRKKPPKGMYINADDLMVMTNAAQSEIIFKELDTEMTNKKREVQYNKQLLSQQRNSMTDKFEEYRPQVSTQRNNVRWTNDELLLAVQAVRKYGKDYQAIADVVGNKNIQQCSSFLVNYRRRFNLDQVLEEYEADQAASNDHKNTESVLSEKQLPLPSQVTGMVANVPPPLLRPSHQPSPKTSVSAQSRFLQPPRSALQQLPPPLIRPASNLPPSQHRAHPAITGPLSRPPQLVGNQNPQESPVSQ